MQGPTGRDKALQDNRHGGNCHLGLLGVIPVVETDADNSSAVIAGEGAQQLGDGLADTGGSCIPAKWMAGR